MQSTKAISDVSGTPPECGLSVGAGNASLPTCEQLLQRHRDAKSVWNDARRVEPNSIRAFHIAIGDVSRRFSPSKIHLNQWVPDLKTTKGDC